MTPETHGGLVEVEKVRMREEEVEQQVVLRRKNSAVEDVRIRIRNHMECNSSEH
jgi:hypothetical protein